MARFKPPLCGFSCAEISGKEAFAPMNDTFMKTKPVFPLLVSMALPNVISMLVNSLYNIVDSLFVAQINEQAMTALSLVFPIQNFVNAVAIGFGVGINALVALYRGAGDHDRADAAATHGMALSVLHGILCTLAATAIMPGFLARFTADGTIVSMGVTYSTIVFLFATVNMASLAFEKLFQAVGRMKLTMIALISGCVCNILLDPVLIFGLGPVPAMGIAGAALATGIGQAATLVIYLVVYSTTESPVHLRRKALRPDLSLEGRLYAIGVPAILNLALPSLLVTFLNGLLAAFSESYVVVLGIYYKLQTFLYLPANGIVQGMRPLIGYNYTSGNRQRMLKAIYGLLIGCLAVSLLITVLLVLLVSLGLGYLTMSLIGGVAGACCSGMEEAGEATGPVMLLTMAGYLASCVVGAVPSGPVAVFSTLCPVVSIFCAPVQFAGGNVSFWLVLASWAIQAAVIWGLLTLASRVYAGLIVHRGSRVKLRELMSMAKGGAVR